MPPSRWRTFSALAYGLFGTLRTNWWRQSTHSVVGGFLVQMVWGFCNENNRRTRGGKSLVQRNILSLWSARNTPQWPRQQFYLKINNRVVQIVSSNEVKDQLLPRPNKCTVRTFQQLSRRLTESIVWPTYKQVGPIPPCGALSLSADSSDTINTIYSLLPAIQKRMSSAHRDSVEIIRQFTNTSPGLH